MFSPGILRLVGIEYDLQKKEAAYRKLLVIAEDDGSIRPKSLEELFDDVRGIHFKSYLRYLYFNTGRLAYLQTNVLVAYIFLAPAIVGGMITLASCSRLSVPLAVSKVQCSIFSGAGRQLSNLQAYTSVFANLKSRSRQALMKRASGAETSAG